MQASPVIVAHRGNSYFAPENSLAAFEAAIGKAEMIEIDVHVSADGALVVMHDVDVKRTSNGNGLITNMTFSALRELDVGAWFHPVFQGEQMPTLEEAMLSIMPHAVPLVERKTGSASAYVAELQRLGIATNIVLQSFDWAFIQEVHALDPTIPLAALGSPALNAATVSNVLSRGASIAAFNNFTPAGVALFQSAGLECYAWTINGTNILKFIDMGVDGIISDDPALATQLIRPTGTLNGIERRMVAHWSMDDGYSDPSATVLSDRYGISDGALHIASPQPVWYGDPLAFMGSCLRVDGSEVYAAVPSTPALNINTNAVSVSAWIMLDVLPSGLASGFASIFDSEEGAYVLYLDRAAKELRFLVTDENYHYAIPGIHESRFEAQQWMHVAATFSGSAGAVSGQARIYLNGRLSDVHTGHEATVRRGLTQPVRTGQAAAFGRKGPSGGNAFSGWVDEFSVWSRELAADEIRALYSLGADGLALNAWLPSPGALLKFRELHAVETGDLTILVENLGPWSTVKLYRAWDPSFLIPEEIAVQPITVGEGLLLFEIPPSDSAQGFFRIGGQ